VHRSDIFVEKMILDLRRDGFASEKSDAAR
jgi:hypothetical protein